MHVSEERCGSGHGSGVRERNPAARSIIGGQRSGESGRTHVGEVNRQLLFLVLELVEAIVNSAKCKKLLVRTFFTQAALMEHQNAMCVLNRA